MVYIITFITLFRKATHKMLNYEIMHNSLKIWISVATCHFKIAMCLNYNGDRFVLNS